MATEKKEERIVHWSVFYYIFGDFGDRQR